MNTKVRNTIGLVLTIAGLIFTFGAVGESDMYVEMGEFLPLMVTVKKVALGFGAMLLGTIMKED